MNDELGGRFKFVLNMLFHMGGAFCNSYLPYIRGTKFY